MENEDIYIKILKFGINRAEGFTYNEIINAKELKKLKEWEEKIIDKYLLNSFRNKQLVDLMKSADYDSMFVIIEGNGSNYKDDKYKYALSLDSRFKYIDYRRIGTNEKNVAQSQSRCENSNMVCCWNYYNFNFFNALAN